MRSTALKQFTRLETTGLWREAPELQRREVIVAFGEASLTISDPRSESALSHWSLPAVERVNPGENPPLFSPGKDALETLELDDPLMIEALERVRVAIATGRARPGRLRGSLLLSSTLLILALVAVILPGALVSHTASVLPPATRLALGRMALGDLTRVAGAPCADPSGQAALDRLGVRIFGPRGPQLLVLRDGAARAMHLPGRIITLHRDLIEPAEGPETVAGFALVEEARALTSDPVVPLLRHAGFFATLKLLTSGQIPSGAVAGYGQILLTRAPEQIAPATLIKAFGAATLPSTPYARAADPEGVTLAALISEDPVRGRTVQPLISDADWLSLQAICAD